MTGSENCASPARIEERMLVIVTIPKMTLQENKHFFFLHSDMEEDKDMESYQILHVQGLSPY